MADPTCLAQVKKGPQAWNEWRKGFPLDWTADLRGASLSGADLRGAHLGGADLSGANLRGAHLGRVHLGTAHLGGAYLGVTIFADVNLGDVKGLEEVVHIAPSTIGIDTIYRSGVEIPEVFLRGAGVSEEFITYMKSLVGKPIEFYSLFISYSTQDQPFAERLHADLQAKGVRCWFAPHDIQGGKKIHEQIDEAIRVYDKLLLILSDASMNSKWVKTEIANARAREEQQNRQMVFPITLLPFERIQAWKLFDADRGIDERSANTSFPTSRSGRTTTPTAAHSTACCATSTV